MTDSKRSARLVPQSAKLKKDFYQSFDGRITGTGWDSAARLAALGMPMQQQQRDPGYKFRQTFQGVISAKPLETAQKKKDVKPVPIEKDSAIRGVVAAGISLNSLRPLQPFGAVWDVFSSPVAVIDETLESFRLPDPNPTINRYIKGPKLEDDGDEDTDGDDIEYDATCLLTESSPTRQRLPNQGMHNSYALEARAIFRGIPSPIDARSLFSAAASASGATMLALEWAGPYSGDEARVGRVRIADHPRLYIDDVVIPELRHTAPDSVEEPDLEMVAPDPGVVDASSTAIFELMFYAINGGAWTLIVTRIR